MKKDNILIIVFVTCFFSLYSQNNSVSLLSGYSNQSFYNLQNGEVKNEVNNNWDIAFETDIYSSTIRINDGFGVELYTYPNGDTSAWNMINLSTINILTSPMYNSDTSWQYGAFSVNQVSSSMDYGWGVYNVATHHIVGDSLFIIRTVDGNWKKLWLDKKVSGTYKFKYADLDGNNEVSATVPASDYSNKRFVYYSITEDLIIDREPELGAWDITFTKYNTPVQGIPYSVTGVLSNQGIKLADATNIPDPFLYTNYNAYTFSQEINTIGYDWKTFDMNSFQYTLDNNRCFFIKDYNQNIWRLIFTQFDGSSTGYIGFDTEILSSTFVGNIVDNNNSLHIYPNPVTNQDISIVYEAVNENVSLSIYDISGREVFYAKLQGDSFKNFSIPANHFERGVYLVSLNINNNILTDRLIIFE